MPTLFSIEDLRHGAGAAQMQGDLAGALVALRAALAIQRQKPGDTRQETELLHLLGDLYVDFGADRRARLIYERALRLMAGSSGSEPARAVVTCQYCHLLIRLGDTAAVPGHLASLDQLIAEMQTGVDPHILARYELLRGHWAYAQVPEDAWDASQAETADRFLKQAIDRYQLLKPWPRPAAEVIALSALRAQRDHQPQLAAERIITALTMCRDYFPTSATRLRVWNVALRLTQEQSKHDLASVLPLAGGAFSVGEALRLGAPSENELPKLLDPFFEQILLASLELGNPEAVYVLSDLSRAPAARSLSWAARSLQRHATLKARLQRAFQNAAKLEFQAETEVDRNTDLWEEAREGLDEVECQFHALDQAMVKTAGVETRRVLSFHVPAAPADLSLTITFPKSPAPIPIGEIQKDFVDHETALLQFVSSGAVAAASVARKDACYSVPLSSLGGEVEIPVPPSTQQDRESCKRLLTQLYRTLILPLESYLKGVSRIIVTPKGVVQQIPLEILIEDPGPSHAADFSGCRFLGERFTFRYLPSPSILPALYRRAREAATKQSTAVAIFADAREAQVLKEAYSGSTGPVAYYPGGKATKAALLLEARRCKILHVGAPCLLHPTNPWLNRLALAGAPQLSSIAQRFFKSMGQAKDTPADMFKNLRVPATVENSLNDHLWACEIRTAELLADLVICSHCETHPVSRIDGGGFPALARAFFQGGIPSVIGNLWRLEQEDRLQFMHSLHQQLRSGVPKDQALLQARRRLMAANRDPFSWGSFVLFGLA